MKTLRITIIFILTSLLLTCSGLPNSGFAHLGKANDLIPLSGEVLTGTLPNGLKYFIMENSYPANKAHLALVVNSGSVLERDDERGLAHFIEHMAFNGTEHFPKFELIEYLRSLGMRFGADANAYTSYNETVYHFEVPTYSVGGNCIPENALAILDDWTNTVAFNPEDVKSESLIILEEYRMGLGAMERVRNKTLPILFAGSAYEDRDPIGLPVIIENASSENLRGFYNRWYTSDNMALIFVGDFYGKELEAEIKKRFDMPAPEQKTNRPVYELPPPEKDNFQVEIITDPELTSSSYMIYYKQNESLQRGTLGFYRQTILDYLIDFMLSSRFEEESANPDSASLGSWGGIWRWAGSSQFYSLGTDPKNNMAEEALRELLLEKESMRRFGFTETELERAKANLISFIEKQVSERNKRDSASFVSSLTSHFLYGDDMADIAWELDAVLTMLPGIRLSEIKKTASNYFSYNDCIVFLIAPQAEAANLPSKERIKEIFIETENAEIEPREAETLSTELLNETPQSGSIINEVIDLETGAVILTLSNGANIILKETENKNNEIIMYAMTKGGITNAPENAAISARLVSDMVNASGLGNFSRSELVNMLAGKQVSVSFWMGDYYRGFQGSSTAEDSKTFFEMLYLFFTQPRLDERAIEAMLAQLKTNLIHQEDDPQIFFSRETNRILTGSNLYFEPLEAADIDKVSAEQARDFLNNCINPGDYTFVFTGNIDIEQMRELSSVYIASIPNAVSMNKWVDPKIIRPKNIEKNLYKGKDDKSSVFLAWCAPAPSTFDEDKNQVSAVLSEYLNILLTNEIREKMSGVYSISAGAYVSVIATGEYLLNVYFQCSPERVDELVTAVKNLITEIYTEPLNTDIFNKAKEALVTQHYGAVQQNLHIAQSYANSAVFYDTPLSRLNKRLDAIKAVQPESVQALCREMLASAPAQIVLYPEKK